MTEGVLLLLLLLLLLGWLLAGRVGKGLYFRCLVGWRREENKAFDIRILNFSFFFSFLHLQPNTVLVEEKVMRGRKWAGFFETFETLSNHVQLLYHPQSPSWRWKKQRRTAMIAKDELFVYKGWGGLKKAKKERISKIYSHSGRARVLCRGYAWLVYF